MMEQPLSGTLPVSQLRKRRNSTRCPGSKQQLSGNDTCHFCLHFLGQRKSSDWLTSVYREVQSFSKMQVFTKANSWPYLLLSGCRLLGCLWRWICFSLRPQCAPRHRDKLPGPWLGLSFCLTHWLLLPPRASLQHFPSSQPTAEPSIMDLGSASERGWGQDWQAWVASVFTPSSWARGFPQAPFWSSQLLPENLFLCHFIITRLFILTNHFITHFQQIPFILCFFLEWLLIFFSTSLNPSSF